MTTTVQDQRERTDQYAQQLLLIEQAAVRAVTVRLVYTLAMLRRQAAGRMLLAQSAAAKDEAASTLARELKAQTAPLLEVDAWKLAIEAEAQRAIDLATVFTLGPANRFVSVLTPEQEVQRAMRSAEATARDRVDRAVKLLERADTPVQVQAALHVAQSATGTLATGAEYAVNSAANSAPRRIAVALGQRLVWVAEPDACVVCLALSGEVIDPNIGESFNEEATFGAPGSAPTVWPPGMPLIGPPRHPHCRCVIQVWNGSVGPAYLAWPLRLKHEALRSIAKGWSLPTESHAARLRAAERILRNGSAGQLPKSVRAEAERAVGRGRFRTRTVPHYPASH